MALSPDPYAVLGVAQDADETVVRAAWRALIRKYHPDTGGNASDAPERLAAVNEAYSMIGDPVRRAAYDGFRGSPPPPPDAPERRVWVESPYPMPPRRRGGATLAMILAFVGLPAVAMTLPGVPGHVASMPQTSDSKAAIFARSSLNQVRRLLTPAGFGASAAAVPRPQAPPGTAPAPDRATIALARVQFGRVARRSGANGITSYSRACADRAASFATWHAVDYCTAFDLAAGRFDDAQADTRYTRLGADPAAASARVAQVRALVGAR
jgi:curved DNA-binding protein CbpA